MSSSKKVSRNQFLKISALALSGSLLASFDTFGKTQRNVGLQLYTLRNELPKDLEGTLKKVADIGYKEVELFGYSDGKYFGKTPKEFKAILKGLGLSAPSGHYTTGKTMPAAKGTLTNDWKRAVDDAAELGQKYMICAFLFPDERKTLDDYKRHAELFNKSAEICKQGGIQFGYHNHDFEFVELEGQVPFDILLKQTDPKMVQMELDLYWVAFAGKDPVQLFQQSPGRFPMWHVKDMEKSAERTFAEVGTGSIDFQRIFDAAKTAGLKHFFVEQDQTKGPAIEAITTSFNNVKKLKI
ncbi:sugar phosphate isomerase/epimerase [Rhodocytophaga aerolata]|uniref:Sugar phosphate isomerase/epimerase n=1 Tax=Rhodocytophaga aerolata TaxID=455078 RepID=A0ABT8QZ12_9BACT|nr:sugar phosphate isomerase/epimerase [Rhodocytophaga aerolata]MDO1445085.1 sugar phosphate isomerase/epimerase [Rhodocytophaga aerolata]